MKPFDRSNITRNLIGHGLVFAGIGLIVWLFWHTDGTLGKYLSEAPDGDGVIVHAGHAFLATNLTVPALWRIVPPALVLILAGAFIMPKKDIRMRDGGLQPRVSFALDDPYRLANAGRLLGGLVIVGFSWAFSDAVVNAIAVSAR